jgi:hypothetical protein
MQSLFQNPTNQNSRNLESFLKFLNPLGLRRSHVTNDESESEGRSRWCVMIAGIQEKFPGWRVTQ